MHPFVEKQITFFEKLKIEYATLWNSLGIEKNQELLALIDLAQCSNNRFNLQLTLHIIRQLHNVNSNINPKLIEKELAGKNTIPHSEIERIDNLLSTFLPKDIDVVTIGKYYIYDKYKYSNRRPDTQLIWTETEVYTYLLGLYDQSLNNIVTTQQQQ